MSFGHRLREMIADGIVVAPGAYDSYCALLIEHAGFAAIYVGGAWASASAFGRPDIGWMTLTELAELVRRMTAVTTLPLIVDADSGYGDTINIYRTVRELEAAGAAGLHIEDHARKSATTLCSPDEMQDRIGAALGARRDPNFLIIARTDARPELGLDEAISRGQGYAKAGADLVFLNWPQSESEIMQAAERIDVPLFVQLTEESRTPMITPQRLEALGVRFVAYPGGPFRAATYAVSAYLRSLQDASPRPSLFSYDHRNSITNLSFFQDWERTHSSAR